MWSAVVLDPAPALAHDAGQRFARGDLEAIQKAEQRMKAERVLPRRRGQFFVGMGDHDGGVDVQAQLARQIGSRSRRPGRGARRGPPGAQLEQMNL
jgi:hypothetical protein